MHQKILIVDDDDAFREVLSIKAAVEGYEVVQARDGREGLALALKEHPHIILLDIMMPEMDGVTVMKELRKSGEWGKNVPIIMLTNVEPEDDRLLQALAEDTPAYYIIKAKYPIGYIFGKVKEKLLATQTG